MARETVFQQETASGPAGIQFRRERVSRLSGSSGSIESVTLVLLYLVVLILVAVVLFGLGSVLFGRGEPLPPLPRATTATVLPASGVTGADVDAVKFTQTVRGYKTSEVDWVLDRLGQELDLLRGQLAAVRAAYGLDDERGRRRAGRRWRARVAQRQGRLVTVEDDGRTSGASGSIDSVTLVLLYLVVLILVAVVLFGLGSVLFGRGEPLPPLPRATTATVLPASGVTGIDVDAVKFTQTLRGYKTSEVDWVLDRLGQELDLLRGQLAAVRAAHGIDDTDNADEPVEGGAHALPSDKDGS